MALTSLHVVVSLSLAEMTGLSRYHTALPQEAVHTPVSSRVYPLSCELPRACVPVGLQVWLYHEGEVTHTGIGHSGNITRVCVSPDGQHVVSVSEDGGILRWRLPHGGADSGSTDQQ